MSVPLGGVRHVALYHIQQVEPTFHFRKLVPPNTTKSEARKATSSVLFPPFGAAASQPPTSAPPFCTTGTTGVSPVATARLGHRVADAADVAIKTRLSSPPASRATIDLARGRLRVLAVARTIPDCCPARQARGSDDNRNRTQSLRPLRHLIYPFTTRWMGMVSVSVTSSPLS